MTTALKLSDVITKNPHFLKADDSVFNAAKIMKEQGVGVIPIVDNNQKPCGIVTDRDVIIRCIAENHDYKQCKINQVYSQQVKTVYEDQNLTEAIDLMKQNQLHRLVCVDRNGKLCGMLTLTDLTRHVKDNNLLGDLVRNIHLEKGRQ